jgi:hypothetical protein
MAQVKGKIRDWKSEFRSEETESGAEESRTKRKRRSGDHWSSPIAAEPHKEDGRKCFYSLFATTYSLHSCRVRVGVAPAR